MTNLAVKKAVGLMSGTSLDGVDAAFLETDGITITRTGSALTLPYPNTLREGLRSAIGQQTAPEALIREMTIFHAHAVEKLLAKEGCAAKTVDVVGFHGQTLFHRPQERITIQIGDGSLLANTCGIPVVCNFRHADVQAGGQGAPLVPLFHAALCKDISGPLAVLNLGGVGNVTYLGNNEQDILAFDTGPANAPLDDWMLHHCNSPYDKNGDFAAQGNINDAAVAAFLNEEYFERIPPKSLDREDFHHVMGRLTNQLSPADGAATLSAMVVGAVLMAQVHFPTSVKRWIVCGGGRHNTTVMNGLSHVLAPSIIETAETYGWDGDALEAQAFAFLAVRSSAGLPLSLPGTTGVPAPQTGGTLFIPQL